jgi:hypothetical protein
MTWCMAVIKRLFAYNFPGIQMPERMTPDSFYARIRAELGIQDKALLNRMQG